MKWIIFNKENISHYKTFIESNPSCGIWHYPEWLTFQINSNRAKDGFYFGVKINNKIVLAGLFLIYTTSLKFNYGYIPAGILYNKINDEIYNFFIKNLIDILKKKKIVFTQIDSITQYEDKYNNIIINKKNHKINDKLPIPQYTNYIDLTLSEENILQQMKSKGRYNIKLSTKKGVIIKKGTISDLTKFYDILTVTANRDGFNLNSLNYYKTLLETIPQSEILIAYYNDKILASGIFTYTKYQGLYYYGASSNEMRNLMAPYLIQWEAMKNAKKHGCIYFDFMGIAPPDNENHSLAGVTTFKLKFGGKIIKFNPSYDIIHNSFIYFLYKTAKLILKH